MKIKTDFVTNSSSTCYIVFVPSKFKATDEALKEAIKDQITWWDPDDDQDSLPSIDEFVEMMREEVEECIESLKDGDDIYRDEYDNGVDYKVFSVVEYIVSEHGLGITSVETGSGGLDQIVGVSEEIIMKILTENLELSSFIKVTRIGDENEKK